MIATDELIKARLNRFNRLYKKATGHTFEEDPEWCANKEKEERTVWQQKVDVWLKKWNLPNLDEFYASLPQLEEPYCGYDWDAVDPEFKQLLWEKPHYCSNYEYEMYCMTQAKEIVDFLATKDENLENAWWKYAKKDGEVVDSDDFVKNMQDDGFDKWDDGHSGNTAGVSIRFANLMIFMPELFPYDHGAISLLVGDDGYHDDRSDIPHEIIEKYNKKD